MIDFDMDMGNHGMNDNDPLVDAPFEALSPAMKYTVMEEVARALLDETQPAPKRTAVNESAIYYVFQWLLAQFEDVQGGAEVWGPNILAALDDDIQEEREDREEASEGEEVEESTYPTLDCLDVSKWESAIDCLWNKILWDVDFEMWQMPDFAPPTSAARSFLYDTMRIDPDYFVPHPGPTKRGARERLNKLIQKVPGVMEDASDVIPISSMMAALQEELHKHAKRS
ncbi:MAG: hypothetical protein WDW38_009956 [Sanguina aurantia]